MSDREGKPDWVVIAKSAGDNGIRYRTNSALIKFIGEIHEEFGLNHSAAQLSAALQVPEVAALVKAINALETEFAISLDDRRAYSVVNAGNEKWYSFVSALAGVNP